MRRSWGLFKQGCQVPILRAGMPAAVGETAGLARMFWADLIGSRQRAGQRRKGVEKIRAYRRYTVAKSRWLRILSAERAALGLMSSAKTFVHRRAAAAKSQDFRPGADIGQLLPLRSRGR